MEEDFEIAIKVVIVGNGAVGKSSMIQRYCKGIFTKDYKKTIGVDFLERELDFDGEDIRLMLWDTAGQEEFDAITKTYYRGAQACVLAFSTTDRDSFDAVPTWKQKVEHEVGELPMVLVQNKIDLVNQAQVSDCEVEDVAHRLKLKLFRTSVKENLNIDAVFEHLTKRYFVELNSKMVEQSKQISIGPSLSSSTYNSVYKSMNSTASSGNNNSSGRRQTASKSQVTELQDIKRNPSKSAGVGSHAHKDSKAKKERCVIS